MSNAERNHATNGLELNKETLQDLDVEANLDGVKGGGLGGDPISGAAVSGPHAAPTDPYKLPGAITPYKGGVVSRG